MIGFDHFWPVLIILEGWSKSAPTQKNRYFDDLGPNSRFPGFGGPKMGSVFDPLFYGFGGFGVVGIYIVLSHTYMSR